MKSRLLCGALLLAGCMTAGLVQAADYVIDTKGAHAFIHFRIQHLGYSWLLGQFNDFSGQFSYDEENPDAASVEVRIKTASIDSSHAERDKHLRGEDFLDVDKYPLAEFSSTGYRENPDRTAVLSGNLTLHGVTRPVQIDVAPVGQGSDPWGGYRMGFTGTTRIKLADYGIDYDLGPASREVDLFFSIEGIRQ
jgi:polyisoprenoid-binding protein YceI